ncbi:MAG TPA: AAA family ATPase [Myxococcota bacterium]|nr:AAA family ATPase [Myxococcota bacterium]
MHPVTEELKLLIESGYPLIYLLTHEEERASRLVAGVMTELGLKAGIWSRTGGVLGKELKEPTRLFKSLDDVKAGATLLLDFHHFLKDPEVLRRIRDILPLLGRSGHSLIVVSPVLVLPPELEKDIALLELPLPSREDLEGLFGRICAAEQVIFPEDFIESVVRAARGLTENEARRVFTKALRKGGGFKLDDISLILEEKKKSIRKSEVLEYLELDEQLDNVGGLEEVKRWVTDRSRAFDDEARQYGLPAPKGLLLIGVQGCGKSLTAKAVAGAWRLPLVRLDLGAVFGSASPETAIHRAVTIAESLAPVVLWVDEIEKGFATSSKGSGNASRVFGSFVTWLQEKRDAVFVVATANEVGDLPPELLRKGRFDETFFVDLPDVHERRDILCIHLERRDRDSKAFELEKLAHQAEFFSGAELEQGVVAGMYRAFGEKREVTSADISKELDEIVPLYATYEEKIKGLREWAKTRARRASVDQSLMDLFEQE